MKLRLRVLAITAGAGLLLVGCSPQAQDAPPTPKPEVLSASEAGGIYLDAVCPVNEAWDEVDVELDRLRLTLSRGEADTERADTERTDTERFADAMLGVAAASKTAAKQLDPKAQAKAGHAWPKDALDEIAEVARTLESDENQANRVAKLTAGKMTDYTWLGAAELGVAASAARESLGLPADGENACAQWRDQASREKAAAEKATAGKNDANKSERATTKKLSPADEKAGTKQ